MYSICYIRTNCHRCTCSPNSHHISDSHRHCILLHSGTIGDTERVLTWTTSALESEVKGLRTTIIGDDVLIRIVNSICYENWSLREETNKYKLKSVFMECLPCALCVMNTLPNTPDWLIPGMPVIHMRVVDLLTVNTTCNFERGGAKKLIIGSSWNNGEKNRFDLCQVRKCSNMILLVVFHWV